MKITGNTILITGGTSGIGRALAEHLHQRGNTVIIAGRRQALLDEVTAAHPGMIGICVDLAEPTAIAAFARDVDARFPALNVLFNNAGISRTETYAASIDLAATLAMIQTNVVSVIQLTAALLPTLQRQPSATILATSSALAFLPLATHPTYCASKAFLHSWLQSLRVQLRATSVEVLELVPPYVQTELTGSAQATDPHAVPLATFIAQVMALLEDLPANGELLTPEARAIRTAERDGTYEQMFAAWNGRA